MDRIWHYWTGYGTLCNTEDARLANSICTEHRKDVSCESCKTLLEALDPVAI